MKRLTCHLVRRALAAREGGELAAWRQRLLDAHVERCYSCAQERRWHRLTRESLTAQRFVAAPSDFAERAVARCAQVRRRPSLFGFLPLAPQFALAALLMTFAYRGAVAFRSAGVAIAPHAEPLRLARAPLGATAPVVALERDESGLLSTDSRSLQVVTAALTVPEATARPARRARRVPSAPRVRPSARVARSSRPAPASKRQPPSETESLIRRSNALMTEGEYGAALTHCQEAVQTSGDELGREQARDLAGRLYAAAGDAALSEVLRGPETVESGDTQPAFGESLAAEATPIRLASAVEATSASLALKRAADALASNGGDPTEIAYRYRAAQRALRDTVAKERNPAALLALADACERVAERRSAVETYSELVQSFPETEESQTAAERLAHLT